MNSTKKQLAIIVALFLILRLAVAQENYLQISGEVVDKYTQLPVGFSTVSIKGFAVGVVSNELGVFDFNFPERYAGDTLVISMVGYHKLMLPVSGAVEEGAQTLELVPNTTVLQEVVVTSEELTADMIVALVKKNIKEHYPQEPFELDAFYRDYKIEDGKCSGILEAAVSIYDRGYKKVANPYTQLEKVKLIQVRKSLNNAFKANVLVNFNVMKGFLSLNDMRYRHRWISKRFQDEYKHEIDGYTTINDRLMYIIKSTSDSWIFKIYVDANNYAVPKIEMNYEWEEDVYENEWTVRDSIRLKQTWAREILEFQQVGDVWLPKFHMFHTENITYDIETNEKLTTTELKQEFLVNAINLQAGNKPRKKERMDPDEPLHLQTPPYDEAFWKNFNIIKLPPLDQKLIDDLEQELSLEQQFKQASYQDQ